jgi:hypothetical protein
MRGFRITDYKDDFGFKRYTLVAESGRPDVDNIVVHTDDEKDLIYELEKWLREAKK